jgi:hypothetical protein
LRVAQNRRSTLKYLPRVVRCGKQAAPMKLFPSPSGLTCALLALSVGASTCSLPFSAFAQGVLAQEVKSAAPTPVLPRAVFIRQWRSRKGKGERVARPLQVLRPGVAPAQIQRGGKQLAHSLVLGEQTVSTGPLSFVLSGFAPEQASLINAYIQAAYPKMVALYGLPAPAQRGKTVRIVASDAGGDGVYVAIPTRPDFNTIYFAPFGPSDLSEKFAGSNGACNDACQANAARAAGEKNNYYIARQMLRAFRGAQQTDFDAWDIGQSDAAALVVNWQVLGQTRFYDPLLYGEYLLPQYDFFNRPNLGNKYFLSLPGEYSKGSTFSNFDLALARGAMAQAAWLKVWVETPSFFARFNAAYFARDTKAVGSDATALSALAASVAPSVEGLLWHDWLRRQHILDTSVRAGEKLYAGAFSFSPDSSGLPYFSAFVFRSITNVAGYEAPLAGVGTLRLFDEAERDVTSLSPDLLDNRVYFDAGGQGALARVPTDGRYVSVGLNPIGTPNQARVTMRFVAGTSEASTFFAHNVVSGGTGTAAKLNGFYGVTTGAKRGRFTLTSNGLSLSGAIERGAWGAPSTYPSTARVLTTFSLAPTDGAAPRVFRRNTAWSFYQSGLNAGQTEGVGFVFETTPSNSSLLANWRVLNANRWRLISLPLNPTESDESRVLEIAPNALRLARYRTTLPQAVNLSRDFPFGITADRHDLYPAIPAPIGPGRAYWLRLDRDKSVAVRGAEPSRARPFEIPISVGWNAIGVPFNAPFALASVRVRVGSTVVDWNEALARGWVVPGVWRWKADGGYARVDASPSATLSPLEGYFAYTTLARASLVFDVAQRGGLLASPPPNGAGAWQVGLSVASGAGSTYAREDNFAFGTVGFTGTVPLRKAAARPPAGERSPLLFFPYAGSSAAQSTRAGLETGWAESFLPPLPSTGGRWSFGVDGARVGERVVLAWGDLKDVPATFDLFLVDETAATRVKMSSLPSRTYSWTGGAGARRFRIEALPRAASSQTAT